MEEVSRAIKARSRRSSAAGLNVRCWLLTRLVKVQRLKEMDLEIIEDKGEGKDFSHVNADDVVILPAFGASVQEMQLLNNRGVQIVDTTCPWVSKVCSARFEVSHIMPP